MPLHAGEWVQVRSKEDILATLDKNGRLESLPFMPQMFLYCGQRFQVYQRAHKTCDTVSGHYVGRRLSSTVHLSLRCNGEHYGGCQAACLIFWKEAWLERVDDAESAPPVVPVGPWPKTAACCTEADVSRATKHGLPGAQTYSCQATELLNFTASLKWWDVRQYAETYRSGNRSLGEMLRGFLFLVYYYGTLSNRPSLGRPGRWIYDRLQMLWGGAPFPRREGQISVGGSTPRVDLNLHPGDLVRVKPYKEILATLDSSGSNRGLSFDAEFVPYCGSTYRVKTRVEQFIDEKTGRMRHLRTPAVILEDVYCKSRYCGQRMFCSRSIYSWWREIWLERVAEEVTCDERRVTKKVAYDERRIA